MRRAGPTAGPCSGLENGFQRWLLPSAIMSKAFPAMAAKGALVSSETVVGATSRAPRTEPFEPAPSTKRSKSWFVRGHLQVAPAVARTGKLEVYLLE